MPFIFRKRDSVRRPSFFFSLGARRQTATNRLAATSTAAMAANTKAKEVASRRMPQTTPVIAEPA